MLVNILYIAIIILYALSVLGYFIDFIQNNQKVKRIAFWLLSIVWVGQLSFIIIRTIEYSRLPLMTIFEGMFLYSWILVSFSLYISHRYKVDFLVLFLNVIGFSILAISIFAPSGDVSPRLAELMILELLVIHVSLILIAYALFTLSFSYSVLYFIQHHMLKQRKWSKRMGRIGNLSKLEKYSFAFNVIGFPLMFLGIILGVVWAWVRFSTVPWFDLKVLTSFVVLTVYGIFIFQWTVRKRRGYNIALLNIAAFLLLLINYFLSSSYTSFHIW